MNGSPNFGPTAGGPFPITVACTGVIGGLSAQLDTVGWTSVTSNPTASSVYTHMPQSTAMPALNEGPLTAPSSTPTSLVTLTVGLANSDHASGTTIIHDGPTSQETVIWSMQVDGPSYTCAAEGMIIPATH